MNYWDFPVTSPALYLTYIARHSPPPPPPPPPLLRHIPPVGVRRGILLSVPLSPLLFDLMIEPLIRWLTTLDKGYDIASCALKLARKWYDVDGTLVTNSMEGIISLLDIVL